MVHILAHFLPRTISLYLPTVIYICRQIPYIDVDDSIPRHDERGYRVPTPIQQKTMLLILIDVDVVAMARTDSWKTTEKEDLNKFIGRGARQIRRRMRLRYPYLVKVRVSMFVDHENVWDLSPSPLISFSRPPFNSPPHSPQSPP